MIRSRRRALLFTTALLVVGLVAACEESSERGVGPTPGPEEVVDEFASPFTGAEAYPVIVSSELVVGESRFQLGLLNEQDAPIGSPDIDVHIEFFNLEESADEAVGGADMDFFWLIEGQRGLYTTDVSFTAPGAWGAEVAISGEGIDETLKTSFTVAEDGTTPAIGEEAPASDTPTADDASDISKISSDPDPDPRFYETSIAEAVRKGDPFVVVFSTPKYCTSQVCGPTLDLVKEVADDFPDVTFVHSEIYRGLDPSTPVVPAVMEWGLPSEPWVFVVDGDGRVAAKFEGSVAPEDLAEEVEAVA